MAKWLSESEKQFIEANYRITSPSYISAVTHRDIHTIRRYISKFSGVRHKHEPINFNEDLDDSIGEFMGVFAGDGCISHDKSGHYAIRIYLGPNESAYSRYVANQILDIFGKAPAIWFDAHSNVNIVKFYGRQAQNIIKKYLKFDKNKSHTVRLAGSISSYSVNFLRSFARGLIATDGCVYHNKYTYRIIFGSTSKLLVTQYKKILDIFSIPYSYYEGYTIKNPFFRVYVSGKKNLRLLKEKINLTESNKLNLLDSLLD